MRELSEELGVSARTLRRDIIILTSEYSLETVQGRGGGVRAADWYHPHRRILSHSQQTALLQALDKVDKSQRKYLKENHHGVRFSSNPESALKRLNGGKGYTQISA
jgi:predicted DNA-binding transcriptional regulator YafY